MHNPALWTNPSFQNRSPKLKSVSNYPRLTVFYLNNLCIGKCLKNSHYGPKSQKYFILFLKPSRVPYLQLFTTVFLYKAWLVKNWPTLLLCLFLRNPFIFFFKGGTKCHRSTHSTHAWLTQCTQNSTNATHDNRHLYNFIDSLSFGRDSNPDPSALNPSECTTTPSTSPILYSKYFSHKFY